MPKLLMSKLVIVGFLQVESIGFYGKHRGRTISCPTGPRVAQMLLLDMIVHEKGRPALRVRPNTLPGYYICIAYGLNLHSLWSPFT